MADQPLRPRGVTSAPANRFDRLHVEYDVESDGTAPTHYYRDASRTILAENDSPDVGFRFSLNPYRGCEHGCSYCLEPATPILHADLTWRPIGSAQPGDVLVGFDEYPRPGRTRKLRASVVEAVVWSRRPTLRLVTDRCDVVTTAEHRWLQSRDFRWSRTEQLTAGRPLRHLPVVADAPIDEDYRVGYLAGLSLGDGTFRFQLGWRSSRLGFPQAYWRVALVDDEPLERLVAYLAPFAVEAAVRPFAVGATSRLPMRKVEVRSLPKLAILDTLLHTERDTRSFRRGFVAGFFDAEGSNSDSLRFSQVEITVLERVQRYVASLGFTSTIERRVGHASTLRLIGTIAERMCFLSTIRPAIRRKLMAVLSREMNLVPDTVRAIEPGPTRDVVDIQTSTRTFLAGGLATHNCYARPSHEYLGFNAGIDFETRIMVKDDAPALLRRQLSSPKWEPQVVALSGNTDCYQPVERKLELTRRCLEVFAEFRNPVGVITKSALVARDADLLCELARHRAAHVALSITSLDPELARRMEPRASHPSKRLEAITTLADAGVPVAVMIGPVIPGLNDEEIPRILAAAADAGATGASWVLLRLAKPLDALFAEWLERNYPDRRERVLGRIRQTRDGRMNDSTFGVRKRGVGIHAAQIRALFAVAEKKHGLDRPWPPLSTAAFRRPPAPGDQLKLL
jgi:DNA repair photolyase